MSADRRSIPAGLPAGSPIDMRTQGQFLAMLAQAGI
jgi:hypothetical protein